MKILIETSARHLHLSEKHLKDLFGPDAVLTNKKDLSQPGQYACEEKVKVIGPKGEMIMTVLGPVRKETQVEVSLTDSRKLGITAEVRESGDINGTGGCKLVGPKGEADIEKGVIVAKRHIHLTPQNAEEFKLTDKQIVSVKVDTCGRSLVFGDVVVRVHKNFAPAMHIDTDESNAAGIAGNVYGEVL